MNKNNNIIERRLEISKQIDELYENELKKIYGISAEEKKILNIKKQQKIIEEAKKNLIDKISKGVEEIGDNEKEQVKYLAEQEAILQRQLKHIDAKNKLFEKLQDLSSNYVGYLMQSDKAIRQTILNLGLSGNKAEMLRKNFEGSAVQLAYLGSNLQELSEMQTIYSDLTGRQTLLYKDAAIAITQIAKGTTLGVQGAGELAGKFELVGTNAENTNKMVQDIISSSENFGVNSNKILKSMNANFKKFVSYGFKTGVAGMSDMAMYSEKFKISMESTLNAADKARTLEGAVELASKLQILGGEFAKTDPFKILHESRNDPKKFMKTINEMTKGMATLRKTEDGFEFDIASPQSRDILAKAAEALGMSTEELSEQAIQMFKIQEMRRQISGSGILNPEDREIIEGMAQFEKSTGEFYVMINNNRKLISKLNKTEIEGLKAQKSTLEDRAKAAQTFDEQLKITVEGLKATMLPLLTILNKSLELISPYMKDLSKFLDSFSDTTKQWIGGIAALGVGLILFKKIGTEIRGTFSFIKDLIPKRGATNIATTATKGLADTALTGAKDTVVDNMKKSGGGVSDTVTKTVDKFNPKTILAIGTAFLALGAGIWMAAKGIAGLAESMKGLDQKQIDGLVKIVGFLTIGMVGLAAALMIIPAPAILATKPLYAVGGAILMMGVGIGIAAAGIGVLAGGMSLLLKSIDPNTILQTALGIGGIATSLLILSTTGLVGMLALTGVLKLLSIYGSDMERIGNSFKNIGTVLSTDASNFTSTANAIKTIAEADVSNNSALSQLAQIFSKPLLVEFNKKEVTMNVKTVINMDGRTIASSLSREIADVTVAAQKGKK